MVSFTSLKASFALLAVSVLVSLPSAFADKPGTTASPPPAVAPPPPAVSTPASAFGSLVIPDRNGCTNQNTISKMCLTLPYTNTSAVSSQYVNSVGGPITYAQMDGSAFGSCKTQTIYNPKDCCVGCAGDNNCKFYLYIYNTPNICYFCDGNGNLPKAGSYAGLIGRCNLGAKILDDPHFVGHHGTRYDFNGALGRSFCLLTDARLHVNALMEGYQPEEGSAGPHKLRTWMREFGFLWRDAAGVTHRLRLVARRGIDASRAAGSLLAQIELDGADVAVPSETDTGISGAGGLTLTLTKQSKHGALDVDSFHLAIEGLLDAEISARAAHPLLQTASDAYVHLNLNIGKVHSVTPAVHGVLGQTYRDDGDREERAMSYSMLAQLLRHPIAADGSEGKGFLDGQMEDYVASGVMEADCKFASAWA